MGLIPVTEELASGSTTLWRVPEVSTILTKGEPIVPLRSLIELGFKIQCNSKGIIKGRDGKNLKCSLRGGCPVIRPPEALELLEQIEEIEKGCKSRVLVTDEANSRHYQPKSWALWPGVTPMLEVFMNAHGTVGSVEGWSRAGG